jgi:hypothetical protein
MNIADINGQLTIIGGISGAILLTYFIIMVYFARQKNQHIQEIQIQLARIEGIIIGRKGR